MVVEKVSLVFKVTIVFFLTNVKIFLLHLCFHTQAPRIFILLEEYTKSVFYLLDSLRWYGHLYKILSTKMSEKI